MSTIVKDKTSNMVTFQTDEGPASGYLALPESKGPGIIVLHAWWGLNHFFKGFCDRLASHGFLVLAPDLHKGAVATTVDEAKALMSKMDEVKVVKPIVLSALEYLRSQPSRSGQKIGLVGFSMGADWALWLSTEKPEDVQAVVTFYGGYRLDFSKAKASFLGHYAPEDEWVPTSDVEALEQKIRGAGREVNFHFYPGTKHWFFEENRPNDYKPESASLAWKRTLDFLQAQLARL